MDIVERLRETARKYKPPEEPMAPIQRQLYDAIAEIERLRAALKPFAAAFHSDNPADEISLHDLRVAYETLEEE